MVKMGQLEAIKLLYNEIRPTDLVVGNMNMETWSIEPIVRSSHPKGYIPKNLLFGVDMGFVTATALGLALALPHRKVITIDGDGSVLMKLAVLGDVAKANPSNLVIVVIDNESYGGLPTEPTVTATVTDLAAVAKACGIKNSMTVKTIIELKAAFTDALKHNGLTLIVAKVELKAEEMKIMFDERHWVDVEWESAFMRNIEETEGITLIPKTTGVKPRVKSK